jgi:hypothetical protein
MSSFSEISDSGRLVGLEMVSVIVKKETAASCESSREREREREREGGEGSTRDRERGRRRQEASLGGGQCAVRDK